MRRRFEHNSKRRRRHSLFQRNPQQNLGAAIGAGFDGAGQGSLTITVEVTGLGTITFNGNAFAKAMAKSSNAAQQNLGAALYNYGAAANALPSARTQMAARRLSAFWHSAPKR